MENLKDGGVGEVSINRFQQQLIIKKMKTKLLLTGLAIVALTVIGNGQNKGNGCGKGPCNGAGRGAGKCQGMNMARADSTGKANCANFANGSGKGNCMNNANGAKQGCGKGCGTAFVDSNKDGICDKHQNSQKK